MKKLLLNLFSELIPKIKYIILFSIILSTMINAQWVNTGSMGTQASVGSIAIEGKLMFACVNGGIYSSKNSGGDWNKADIPSLGNMLHCVSVNDSVVIAGSDGSGIIISTDFGITWNEANNGLANKYVQSFLFDGNQIFAGTYDGVFISSDEGKNWESRNSGIQNFTIQSLFKMNGILYAGTGSKGVYISTDSGSSWSASNKGIENSSVTSFAQLGSNIFIGTDNTGIYYTSDNGKNWSQSKTNLPDSQIESLTVLKGILYAGTFNFYVYSSSDNGMTWQPFSNGLNDPTVFALAANDSCIYAGTISLGIFKLSYGNTTWQPVNKGFPGTVAYCLAVKGDTIVAGTQFDGVFISFNSGDTWLHRTSNLPNTSDNNINTIAIQDSMVFVGRGMSGLYYSDNWGLSWTSVDAGFFTNQQVVAFTAIGDRYYAGLSEVGIYRSLDKGKSWKLFNSNLPENIYPAKFYWYGSYLFLGLYNSPAYPGGLYRLAPGDSSWTEMKLGINNPSINDIVSGHGRIFAATNNGIFYSIDTGNTWYHLNPNLPFTHVNSLTIIPNNGTLISSNELGASVSYDLGHSWILENQGFSKGSYPNTLVLNNKFIFATTSEGIMRRSLSELIGTVGIKEEDHNNLPDKFSLEQNYPNPFNPSTKIEYSIPHSEKVTIQIYNILGKRVATLVNEEKPAGNYEIVFDGSNLPSGVYFYQIRAGSYIETRKMLLLK